MMGYEENSGVVTLRMTLNDYQNLLFALGIACGWAAKENLDMTPHLELINRINQGNPKFIPYAIGEKK